MSRTVKGKKAPGYEYWSRRPFNKYGGTPGRLTKHLTHKVERLNGKEAVRVWVDEMVRKD